MNELIPLKNKTDELNYKVVQSNKFVQFQQAYEQAALTNIEKNIVAYAISKIRKGQQEFEPVIINIKEFCELLGINASAGKNYMMIRNAIENAAKKRCFIPKPDGGEKLFTWISDAESNREKTEFIIKLHDSLKPVLLNLGIENNFNSYILGVLFKLEGKYSKRIYELLNSYVNLKQLTISVKEFREKVNIVGKTYNNFGNLKNRVIDPSIDEINLKTDIKISICYGKEGKQITNLIFYIERQDSSVNQQEISIPKTTTGQKNEILEDVLRSFFIPEKYYQSRRTIQIIIHKFCGWNKYKNAFEDAFEQSLYNSCVNALIELCNSSEIQIIANQRITADYALDLVNQELLMRKRENNSDYKTNGALSPLIFETMRVAKQKDISDIKNKKAYLKSILYNILTSPLEKNAISQSANLTVEQKIFSEMLKAAPSLSGLIDLYFTDKYDYLKSKDDYDKKHIFDSLKKCIDVVKRSGYTEDDFFKYCIPSEMSYLKTIGFINS